MRRFFPARKTGKREHRSSRPWSPTLVLEEKTGGAPTHEKISESEKTLVDPSTLEERTARGRILHGGDGGMCDIVFVFVGGDG